MNAEDKRPRYSFRWTILLWILGPFALIAISDVLFSLNIQYPASPLLRLVTIAYGLAFYGLIIWLVVKLIIWLYRGFRQ